MNKLAQHRLDRLNKIHRHVKDDPEATVLDLKAQPGWMNVQDWYFVQLTKCEQRIAELEDGIRAALAHEDDAPIGDAMLDISIMVDRLEALLGGDADE